ncbi:hypothetical protein T265_06659 [Opisthorchis viverrini]|uniref:Uncharacterized protein n=1 Tax=Opisthorchis viverrini TaxID=6198 RepID=A0A075ADE7_OPIVI|nr:hypothetical protein T265_06659 [Opisthorchis viverrini]KER26024.1 hypothetical protein T265_06659 [Opisthorchis viverrini]
METKPQPPPPCILNVSAVSTAALVLHKSCIPSCRRQLIFRCHQFLEKNPFDHALQKTLMVARQRFLDNRLSKISHFPSLVPNSQGYRLQDFAKDLATQLDVSRLLMPRSGTLDSAFLWRPSTSCSPPNYWLRTSNLT